MAKICTMAMIDILAVVAIMAVVELKGVKHAFIFLIQEPRQECGRSGGWSIRGQRLERRPSCSFAGRIDPVEL